MTISKATRQKIIQWLDASAQWDASTLRITADGTVTACKDADKTYNPRDTARYNVADVEDFMDGGRLSAEVA